MPLRARAVRGEIQIIASPTALSRPYRSVPFSPPLALSPRTLAHVAARLLHLLHLQVNPGKIISKVDPKHIIKTIHSRTSQYEARNSPKCSPQISPMKAHERKVSAFELKVREARRRGEAGPVQRSYSI